jgi:hypothetical protein
MITTRMPTSSAATANMQQKAGGVCCKSFARGPASIIDGEGVSKYPSPMHRLERTGADFKAEKSRLSGAPAKKTFCGWDVSLKNAA